MWTSYLKTFFLLFVVSYASMLQGQVNPPDFICVSSDTLYWSPGSNACGPFLSLDIYASSDRNGPYSLLASVTDAASTNYHHPTSDNTYYYLIYNHDCPGETAIPSDTLDNVTIPSTQIEAVSVEDNGTRISWYPNTDPKTNGYIIYSSTPQGTLPVDTVFGSNTTSYLDITSSSNSQSQIYYVVAIDRCNNPGLFDDPHQTVFLNTTINYCEQYMQLTWNPYINWQQGIDAVEIWVGLDGQPLQYEHRVQPSDTLAYIANIQDNRQYCVAIIYEEANTGVLSMSNTVCFTSDVISSLDDLSIRNVSVNPNGTIDITWFRTVEADLDTLDLLRGLDNLALEPIGDLLDPMPSGDNISRDNSALTSSEQYFYQIYGVDACDTVTSSNVMSSVLLNVQQDGTMKNDLMWTPFVAPGREIIRQDICRNSLGSPESIVGSVGPNVTTFIDDLGNIALDSLCYTIKVVHALANGSDTLVARSNQFCVIPTVEVYIPNAFVPAGLNRVFMPRFTNPNIIFEEYNFTIVNRWGGQVFHTDNPGISWDGTQDGSPLPEGVYVYVLQFKQAGAQPVQKAGSVTLLR